MIYRRIFSEMSSNRKLAHCNCADFSCSHFF